MALSTPAYRAMLLSTILASSMAFIDGTALNIALPALQNDLQLTASQLLWIVNAYILFLSALLLLGGSLGDIYGRKRVFTIGILIFTAASIGCGFMNNAIGLILFRAVQGIGGALMVPGSLSLITALTSPERKGTAIGTWSMFSSLTTVLGPLIGGILADAGLWRMIFFINVPLAAISVFALIRYVPESRGEATEWIDIPGVILGTLSLGLLTYGFTEAARLGYQNTFVRTSIILGAIMFVVFLIVESRSSHPLLPLKIFRNIPFTVGNTVTFLTYAALGALLFFFPLNLIQIQGYSASEAGLTLLPFGVLIAVFSGISGRLADRIGPRSPMIFGQVLTTMGFFLFSIPGQTQGASEYWTTYFPAILCFGVGMGLTVAPLTTLVMNSVEPKYTGVASGVNNTIARSSQVLAVAIIGSFAIIQFSGFMEAELTAFMDEDSIAILSPEFEKFGNSQPPDNLDDNLSQTFEIARNQGFIHVFRQIALISCILTGFSTCLSFLSVPRR